ncbi:MAG: bifunctional isocitrate dehydrogenase kinase/phosphatase [Chloroflexi bacterium]|nr:bifunctional isocitrate dehydrogenase kinase/phosphatase [Chloroflexota bacterium]
MISTLTDSRLATVCASAIYQAFDQYQTEFHAITRHAYDRFRTRDWRGMQADATERIELYNRFKHSTIAQVRQLIAERRDDKLVWASIKAVYSAMISSRDDWEIAETFFNSITRRIFSTVGVDPQVEFVDTDFNAPPTPSPQRVFRTYSRPESTAALIANIFSDFPLGVEFQDATRATQLAAFEIETHLQALNISAIERAEIARTVFYRGSAAYLIGKIYNGSKIVPLVLALLNSGSGIGLDAVLLTEDEVSILFSFAHSYFHVEVERPYDLVHFLHALMPRKRIAELYISIGYHKHGKTEIYRDLLCHLAQAEDKFQIARGERGMVMTVFTMQSYDLVLKIIKDKFQQPKDSTREQVRAKYNFIFTHDRAGRLIDAQEFEHLQFDRILFSKELLDELQRVAANSVLIDETRVVIKHLYVERRLTPLNLFIREADDASIRAAVIDYGNAIRNLAAANVFPGDLLLKNFGVTRHGHVVLYDYDEVCLLTDCHFRALPQAHSSDEEIASEAWFYVAPNDIFPEEFSTWLGLPSPWREVFTEYHGDLFTVNFWQSTQDRIKNGQVIHIFPYPPNKRLSEISV